MRGNLAIPKENTKTLHQSLIPLHIGNNYLACRGIYFCKRAISNPHKKRFGAEGYFLNLPLPNNCRTSIHYIGLPYQSVPLIC